MTVTSETSKVTYTGNGVTTQFAYTFLIIDATHLVVERADSVTNIVNLTYTAADYTVTGLNTEAGGILTLAGTPLTSASKLIIRRLVPYTQELDLLINGGFFPDQIERQFDKVVMQIQQLHAAILAL